MVINRILPSYNLDKADMHRRISAYFIGNFLIAPQKIHSTDLKSASEYLN